MQRVPTDWTTRSEAQTGCLQATVVASGFPPSIAGAHCCAECKVWAALIKKDMFDLVPPTMYQLFFGLWRGPQSLKTTALFKNPHVYATKDLENPVLFSLENVSRRPYPYTVLLGPWWVKTWAQGRPSWTRAPAESEEGAKPQTPLFPKLYILAQGFLHLEAGTHCPNLHKVTQQ